MGTKAIRTIGLPSLIFALLVLAKPVQADESPGDLTSPGPIPGVKQVFLDPIDDYALRRCDIDPYSLPISTNGPEFLYATMGRWNPVDAYADPYFGNYNTNGGFARIDLVFDGLVNPPGTLNGLYNPAKYGPNPLFGYMELDMDSNENTGGDAEEEDRRYCAHVARFGGIPQGARFVDRIGIDGYSWSGVFGELPATYRSGNELTVYFQGDFLTNMQDIGSNGDMDSLFEWGETWTCTGGIISAYGYDPITYAYGYDLKTSLRFSHSVTDNQTTVSLVIPRTNADYAVLNNDYPPQSNDFSSMNATSIYEALWGIYESARDPKPGATSHDYWPILADWASQDPLDYIDPISWRATAVFGTAIYPITPSGWNLSWTDTWPNVIAGDFNGDGLVSETDRQMTVDYIALWDGNGERDADGAVNSIVDVVDFPYSYSVYDTDYDGYVSTVGFAHQNPDDYDNDGDVDLVDYQMFQICFSVAPLDPLELRNVGCLDAFDDNGDMDIDTTDFEKFINELSGP